MASSASERRPRIGVTTYIEQARWGAWDRPAALLPRNYIDGVAAAGGVPLLLPPIDDADADHAGAAVDALDGLLLAGGADLEPALYGQSPHAETTDVRPDRDRWEMAVLAAALDRHLPVLAVCRGVQLLNVACGGTLHQHVPDVVGTTDHRPEPTVHGTNRVRIEPASRLAAILGDETKVPCYHHQALDQLGAGLTAVAHADDGTIEAVELDGRAFVVGVQWHPEEGDDLRLFDAFIDAARSRGNSSPPGPAIASRMESAEP